MSYKINTTESYHLEDLDSLGWELTVCNSLESENNPVRKIIKNNTTFGNLLYQYFSTLIPIESFTSIVEIGGGYGYLMRDILNKNQTCTALMIDISPFLLKKQQETLKSKSVEYKEINFFKTDISLYNNVQLALLNENIGDFPTICDLSKDSFNELQNDKNPLISETLRIISHYSLPVPDHDTFSINIGACLAIEKLCKADIPNIYISEHSCEAITPPEYKDYFSIKKSENPERITLRGHDEYTIKFSHLEKIADYYNYSIIRNNFLSFINIRDLDKLRFILTSHSGKDDHEIIRHFVEDLIKYEFLLLIKK